MRYSKKAITNEPNETSTNKPVCKDNTNKSFTIDRTRKKRPNRT